MLGTILECGRKGLTRQSQFETVTDWDSQGKTVSEQRWATPLAFETDVLRQEQTHSSGNWITRSSCLMAQVLLTVEVKWFLMKCRLEAEVAAVEDRVQKRR